MPDAITKRQFQRMNAFSKGYAVYTLGSREDQPNVPESYEPTERTRREYEAGQAAAVQEARDDA